MTQLVSRRKRAKIAPNEPKFEVLFGERGQVRKCGKYITAVDIPSRYKRIYFADEKTYVYDTRLYAVCNDCHKVYEKSSVHEGCEYCAECRPNHYTHCDHCGQWKRGRGYTVAVRYNGHGDYAFERWCDECVSDYAVRCTACSRRISRDLLGEHNCCPSCEETLTECPSCHSLHPSHDMEDVNGTLVCHSCARGMKPRFRGYHENPEVRFNGTGNCFIGCEIETENESREATMAIVGKAGSSASMSCNEQYIYMMHDGSLGCNGIECITQPMTLDFWNSFDFEGLFKSMVKAGSRSHDTRTCGLHVHLSRKWFGGSGEDRAENIGKTIYFVDRWWDNFAILSRRKSFNWCRRPSDEDFSYEKQDALERASESKSVGDFRKLGHLSGDHYDSVETRHENTVEFRMCRGTLNPETYRASVLLWIRLVNFVKVVDCSIIDTYGWDDFMRFAPMPAVLGRYIENKLHLRVEEPENEEAVLAAA